MCCNNIYLAELKISQLTTELITTKQLLADTRQQLEQERLKVSYHI